VLAVIVVNEEKTVNRIELVELAIMSKRAIGANSIG